MGRRARSRRGKQVSLATALTVLACIVVGVVAVGFAKRLLKHKTDEMISKQFPKIGQEPRQP